MDTERQTKISSSLPFFAILALIGGALYVSQRPLESSRPEVPAGPRQPIGEEDKIEARLWQDPLKVALDHKQVMHVGRGYGTCTSEHRVDQVRDRITAHIRPNGQDAIVHVLLTMVRSGPFAEDSERRLRNRYAMVTALHSSGFIPDDSEHITYFKLVWPTRNELERRIWQNQDPIIDAVQDKVSEPLILPYEWFERRVDGSRRESVLVVWLSESAFYHRPLIRLAQIIDALSDAKHDNLKVSLIGPSYSGTLRAMIREIELFHSYKTQGEDFSFAYVNTILEGLTIFSPWSTTSPVLLVDDWPDQSLNDNSLSSLYEVIPREFEKIGVTFIRMIGSDDLLAIELINELRRRGVDLAGGRDHVALLSEWDTFYGDTFPLMFVTMMAHIDPDTGRLRDWADYAANLNLTMIGCDSDFPGNLHTYSYIRGIDGKLPEAESSEEQQRDKQTESKSRPIYAKSLELPIGRSQLDYIRRLTNKLSEKYKRLGGNRLKAIGVVGSDVYDKLILLHALRDEFSDVILFTVDLDARIMHHEQVTWARNVIVASNYGLELNDHYQQADFQGQEGTLSPFRDNYQTALFLACRAALGLRTPAGTLLRDMEPRELTEVISHPRLFEIGRGRAVDLSIDDADIHPPRRQRPWTLLTLVVPILLAIVLGILLLVQISKAARNIVVAMSPLKRDIAGNTVTVFVLAVIVFVVVVVIDHYRPGGEPFSLSAGVSIWPGEALRLIAAILSGYFIVKSLKDLRANDAELCDEFCFRQSHPWTRVTFTTWCRTKKARECVKTGLFGRSFHHVWIGFDWIRRWLSYYHRIDIYKSKTKKHRVDAQQLWTAYLIRGTCCNRFHRLIPMSLAYVGLAFTLMWIFGPPNTPYRGNVSFLLDRVLLASSVITMIILMFLVVDATKLSLNFVRNLKTPATIWPDELLDRFIGKKSNQTDGQTVQATKVSERSMDRVGKKALAEGFDIKFIATHTEAVGKLIYYPFIVLLITFVARNRYFDNWNCPIPLVIILLLYLVHALGCGWMLRREAEKARRVALDRLGNKLVKAKGAGDERGTDQIEGWIEEIKSIRQGAFRPFQDSPVIRVLIGSGGAGLLTVLRLVLAS